MKKEGMFFGEREKVADGNFMKLAKCKAMHGTGGTIGDMVKKPPPPDVPIKSPEVKEQKVKPLPIQQPKPETAKLAMPFGTGIGIGGSPQFGGSGVAQTQMASTMTGAGGTPGMGTGEKVKKLKKQAEGPGEAWSAAGDAWKKLLKSLPETAKATGEKLVRGAGEAAGGAALMAGRGAKSLAEASPLTQAAALGIPAYLLYRKGKGVAKKLVRKKPPPGVGTALRKLFTRGR